MASENQATNRPIRSLMPSIKRSNAAHGRFLHHRNIPIRRETGCIECGVIKQHSFCLRVRPDSKMRSTDPGTDSAGSSTMVGNAHRIASAITWMMTNGMTPR